MDAETRSGEVGGPAQEVHLLVRAGSVEDHDNPSPPNPSKYTLIDGAPDGLADPLIVMVQVPGLLPGPNVNRSFPDVPPKLISTGPEAANGEPSGLIGGSKFPTIGIAKEAPN